MRIPAAAAIGLMALLAAAPVHAALLISIDKSTQRMTVSLDGVQLHEFTVSTGRAGYSTPNGTYQPQWMTRRWFSRQYYNSPMPYSIFFHRGYAIHGSYEINRLGGPASHGCVRLHPNNAKTLYELVQRHGMADTTIVVHGTNPPSRTTTRKTRRHRPRYIGPPVYRRPPPWVVPWYGWPRYGWPPY